MPTTEETQTAILTALNTLINVTRSNGGGPASTKNNFDSLNQSAGKSAKALAEEILTRKRQEESYKKATQSFGGAIAEMKKLSKTTNALTDMSVLANKSFSNLVDNLDAEGIEKAANILKQQLKQSGNAYANSMSHIVNNGKDLLTIQSRLRNGAFEEFKQLREKFQQNKDNATIRTEMIDKAKELGFTLSDFDKSLLQLINGQKALATAIVSTSQEMGGLPSGATRLNTSFKLTTAGVTAFGAALYGVGNSALKLAESAAKTGTEVDAINATLMGMSSEELNGIQAEHMQIIKASGMTLEQFDKKIASSGSEMILYTGSLKDAARIEAQSIEQAKLLGANQKTYMDTERERFKRLHNSLSVTSEQFLELNDHLLNNIDVQSTLSRLNKGQRTAYMQELKNTHEKLMLDGQTMEQSKKIIDTFAAMSAASPIERMKQAAKAQAMMGAMGMGQQGAQMAEMIRNRDTTSPEFLKLAESMQAEIQGRMQQGSGQERFAQETLMYQMLEKTGLNKIFGPDGALVSLGTREGAKIENPNVGTENLLKDQLGQNADFAAKAMEINQQIHSALSSDIYGTLSTLATFIMGKGMLEGTLALAGETLASTAAAGVAAAGGAAAAGAAALGLALAGGAGYAVGTALDKTFKTIAPESHAATSDFIGNSIATALAAMGNEEAKQTLETNAKNHELLNKLNDGINKVAEGVDKTADHAKATADGVKGTSEKVKEQTDQQKELSEKAENAAKKASSIRWIKMSKSK